MKTPVIHCGSRRGNFFFFFNSEPNNFTPFNDKIIKKKKLSLKRLNIISIEKQTMFSVAFAR